MGDNPTTTPVPATDRIWTGSAADLDVVSKRHAPKRRRLSRRTEPSSLSGHRGGPPPFPATGDDDPEGDPRFTGEDRSRSARGFTSLDVEPDGTWTIGAVATSFTMFRTIAVHWQCHLVYSSDLVNGGPVHVTVRTGTRSIPSGETRSLSASGQKPVLAGDGLMEAIAAIGYADCDLVLD